jgi:hypothetical protein
VGFENNSPQKSLVAKRLRVPELQVIAVPVVAANLAFELLHVWQQNP